MPYSGNSTYELSKLPGERLAHFATFPQKQSTGGIRFVSPAGHILDLDLLGSRPGLDSPGYVCSRLDFDAFLYSEAIKSGTVFIQDKVTKVERCKLPDNRPGFILSGANDRYSAPLLLVADGVNGPISKALTEGKLLRRHHSAGLRCYMENVSGFSENKLIELHFLPELLPGYFWLFPMQNNIANIGLGVRSDVVQKKRLDLKAIFNELIERHPVLSKRFTEAKALENIQGAGLPLGSTWRANAGDGFMLLGDAAGLVDPFSARVLGMPWQVED
jgi:menaquinone-9 beta-reductase